MTDDNADLLTERTAALGLVVEWSAMMEHTLRNAFCSLVGSKFAATIAGGQTAAWLIEQCRKLTEVNRQISDDAKQAIREALDACTAANGRRNTLVHGIKTASRVTDGRLQTIRSRRGTHVPAVESWVPADIRDAGGALLQADLRLFAAMQAAVNPEMMVIGDTLGWEDVKKTPGQQ